MAASAVNRPASPGWYAIVIVLALMALGPIIVMLGTSLKTRNQIFGDTASFFFMPTLANYQAVLEDPANVRFLTNSLIVAIVSTAITLTLGCMAAYAIVRFRFMGGMRRRWALC